MLKRTLMLSFVMSAALAVGQVESDTVTVTASQTVNLQPDQVLFAVSVTTPINASLDDVLAALKGSGITIVTFPGSTAPTLSHQALLLTAIRKPRPLSSGLSDWVCRLRR
jgi:DNA-binding MurR/RpiR family transcriptional regulator